MSCRSLLQLTLSSLQLTLGYMPRAHVFWARGSARSVSLKDMSDYGVLYRQKLSLQAARDCPVGDRAVHFEMSVCTRENNHEEVKLDIDVGM